MPELFVHIVLASAAVIYVLATSLLFIFGTNMLALSFAVWRRGTHRPPTEGELDVETSSTDAGNKRATEAVTAGVSPLNTVSLNTVSLNTVSFDMEGAAVGNNQVAVATATPGSTRHAGLPHVTVQLPVYNELYVAERVIDAACAMDYPQDRVQIQVLDDSTDETYLVIAQAVAKHRANGVDTEHVHRTNRVGYKAGALQAGLATATGEFVAIFDADFFPPPDFLLRSLPSFEDEAIAFVQTRWGHLNRDYSWVTRLQSLAIDAHFMVEQAARGHLGYWFNFNGTAGVWRVAAIEDAGGWTHETLTEDLDLSYRAHLKGWRGQYLVDVETPGELPAQMSSFRRQQHRWARGSLECARKLLGPVWRSDANRATKFQATAHLTAYAIHLLLFVLAMIYPLVVLASARFSGFSTLYGLGYIFALSSLAPGVFFVVGQHQLSGRWWTEIPRMTLVTIIGSGLMLNTCRAALQIFTRPNPEFERTAKFGLQGNEPVGKSWTHKRYQLDFDRIVYAEAALGAYCFFSAWMAFSERNWGILLYATIFGIGLFGVAAITVGQSIALYRSRDARKAGLETEQATLVRAAGPANDLRDASD